eukprot:CAMPEP_0204267186 /NCGR_PEP_ID=MMETSP0468-20130131/10793_1 /ASSEMBLY_ACC=CAM_ASM_000383 /TAXON_ID=2969 /ORGANISM="Oxyrrhis marina" /LENGTH=135 /DNA_ID=CAMNT_0051242331 /DNA_START=492 /DNA_END=898 /DNA_ORIENTATION=-
MTSAFGASVGGVTPGQDLGDHTGCASRPLRRGASARRGLGLRSRRSRASIRGGRRKSIVRRRSRFADRASNAGVCLRPTGACNCCGNSVERKIFEQQHHGSLASICQRQSRRRESSTGQSAEPDAGSKLEYHPAR